MTVDFPYRKCAVFSRSRIFFRMLIKIGRSFALPVGLSLSLFCAGCRHVAPEGAYRLPGNIDPQPGVFADMNPRWSHDGTRIAFLRATPDRYQQLFLIDSELERPLPLLESELVSPDRNYSSDLESYRSPETLAWSPGDREIAFERAEWFTFEDGERLPGTGLWAYEIGSGRVTALALHPRHYKRGYYYYHYPAWSPTGRSFAFIGEGINGQRVLFVRSLFAQSAYQSRQRFDQYEDVDWPTWAAHNGQNSAVAESPLIYRAGIHPSPSSSITETLRLLTSGSANNADAGEIWRITAAHYSKTNHYRPGRIVAPRIGHLAWSPVADAVMFTLTPDANDFQQYELWEWKRKDKTAARVSPKNGKGYIAPVWIDAHRVGALSPYDKQFKVVVIDTTTGKAQDIAIIPTADCDWSPDRTRIVYSSGNAAFPANANRISTLRLLDVLTGKTVQAAAKSASGPAVELPSQAIGGFRQFNRL